MSKNPSVYHKINIQLLLQQNLISTRIYEKILGKENTLYLMKYIRRIHLGPDELYTTDTKDFKKTHKHGTAKPIKMLDMERYWICPLHLSCLMTKPTKWSVHPAKTQISLGICPVWSESSMCTQSVAIKDLSFLHADSEDSDQTGRMPRLIWVFAGRTCHFIGFVMRWLIFFSHSWLLQGSHSL